MTKPNLKIGTTLLEEVEGAKECAKSTSSSVFYDIQAVAFAAVYALLSPQGAQAQTYAPVDYTAISLGAQFEHEGAGFDFDFALRQNIWFGENGSAYGSQDLHGDLHVPFRLLQHEGFSASFIPSVGGGASLLGDDVAHTIGHVELGAAVLLEADILSLQSGVTVSDGETGYDVSLGIDPVHFGVSWGNHGPHIPPQLLGLPEGLTHVHPLNEEVPVFLGLRCGVGELGLGYFNGINAEYTTTRWVNDDRTYPNFKGDMFALSLQFNDGEAHEGYHHH